MFVLILVGVIVVGAIAVMGGGNTFDGMGRDTRNVSDDMSRHHND